MTTATFKDFSGQLYVVIQEIWACIQASDTHVDNSYALDPENYLMFLGETETFLMQEDWIRATKKSYFKFFDLKHRKVCWIRNDYVTAESIKLVPCNS